MDNSEDNPDSHKVQKYSKRERFRKKLLKEFGPLDLSNVIDINDRIREQNIYDSIFPIGTIGHINSAPIHPR